MSQYDGDDRDLMRAIQIQADRADAAKPQLLDTLAIAVALAERFLHRSVEQIQKSVQQHFRSRGLFWAE
jgi:ribonuclease I